MHEDNIAFEKAKNEVVSYLIDKYNFDLQSSNINRTTLSKNNMQLSISFDLKEGSDLIFLDKSWQSHQYKRFLSFIFLEYPSYSTAKPRIKQMFKDREQFETPYNFFKNSLMTQIQYIASKHPQVFENGDLTMFN
jgi:hypothetical protein